MSIRVYHTLDDLEDDFRRIAVEASVQTTRIVRKNVERGERLARTLARERAGPHGKNYYKRITSEMTGPTSGEYGPEGEPKTEFVGAGWRHSAPPLDLPQSADVVGPQMASDLSDMLDGLFW